MTDWTLASSGERFTALYRLVCPPAEAAQRAREICIEQTIEFPPQLIAEQAIHDQIIGRVARLEAVGPDTFEAAIDYPIEVAGRELTQLINVLFGNSSLKPGIRLQRFELPDALARAYPGPRFGQSGIRALFGASRGPLLCTAIKPMGRSPKALAELAYQLALGGIDLIKDDHGLADQSFCPFAERVPRCADAVARANRITGGRSRYVTNITAPTGEVHRRAEQAKAAGAGGLLLCPGLTGFDTMRSLAATEELALPILSHPAFLGAYCQSRDAGLAHRVLFGQLTRLAGADATIFPHAGGRFAFTEAECRELAAGATEPMGSLEPIFPVPAGGLSLGRIAEVRNFYRDDCILLIGGDLHAQGSDLVATCRRFVALARGS